MRGVTLALAPEMRGSRPAEELSGFEDCLLGSGGYDGTTIHLGGQLQQRPAVCRIISTHLGLANEWALS